MELPYAALPEVAAGSACIVPAWGEVALEAAAADVAVGAAGAVEAAAELVGRKADIAGMDACPLRWVAVRWRTRHHLEY